MENEYDGSVDHVRHDNMCCPAEKAAAAINSAAEVRSRYS